jgi:hypothetical protein
MYSVVRRYTGVSALIEAMTSKQKSVHDTIAGTPGFVAYYALRDGDGLTTVTVCADKTGTEESTRRAAAWVRENVPGVTIGPPTVNSGEVFITFGK